MRPVGVESSEASRWSFGLGRVSGRQSLHSPTVGSMSAGHGSSCLMPLQGTRGAKRVTRRRGLPGRTATTRRPAAGMRSAPLPVVDNLTAGISPSAIFLRTVNSDTDNISATARRR